MEYYISRSEKKRLAKEVEKLSQELSELPPADLAKLPCDDFLREEIMLARNLKGGARKRQVKYIAKELRQQPIEKFLEFLAEQKGSRLKQDRELHGIEKLRDDILDEAIREYNTRKEEGYFTMSLESPALQQAGKLFPDFDLTAAGRAAENFAATRKPAQKRELFRILKAAAERNRYADNTGGQ